MKQELNLLDGYTPTNDLLNDAKQIIEVFSAMNARKLVPQKHFIDRFPSFSTTEGCHLSIFHCMLETPKRRGGIQL